MVQRVAYSLDFEKPILELEHKIEELKGLANKEGLDFNEEISRLQSHLKKLEEETLAHLSPLAKSAISTAP